MRALHSERDLGRDPVAADQARRPPLEHLRTSRDQVDLLRRALLCVAGLIAVASLVCDVVDASVTPLPDALVLGLSGNSEVGLGTWWSVLQLGVAGLLAAALVWRCWSDVAARNGFALLSALLLALSVDEEVGVHEEVSDVLAVRFEVSGESYPAWGLWVVPAMVVLAVVAYLFARTFRRLPAPIQRGLLGGAAVFVLGAVALETLSAVVSVSVADEVLFLAFEIALEELCEMVGIALVVWSLVRLHTRLELAPARGSASISA